MKTDVRLVPWVRRLAMATGGAVALLGLTVIAGWFAGSSALTQIRPEFAAMQFNTALAFLNAGLALVAFAWGAYRTMRVLVAWPILVGLLTLIQYAFDVQLGIDQLFLKVAATTGVSHPGRMGANTATAFVLVGLALWLATLRPVLTRAWIIIGTLAMFTFVLAASVLLAYVARVSLGLSWGVFTQMAVHTASGFVVLSLGLLAITWNDFRGGDAASDTFLSERSRFSPAWAVLVAGLTLTLLAWYAAQENIQRDAMQRFDQTVQRIEETLRVRMQHHAQILYGARGLILASENVDRKEWHDFVNSLTLEVHYPGIQAVGLSLRVPSSEYSRHTQKIRAQGFPRYAIGPPGSRDEYFPIVYIEPFEGSNLRAFGYDMYAEPTRRAAMRYARDQSTPALSGKVVLVQETGADVQAGFILYLPVYRKGQAIDTPEQRQAALIGFVYSPYRANDLMVSLFAKIPPKITFKIYDGKEVNPEKLIYDDDVSTARADAGRHSRFHQVRSVEIYGQWWTLSYNSRRAFDAEVASLVPILILLGGTLMSLLLFGFVWSLSSTRERALRLASEMDMKRVQAQAEKQLLLTILEQTPDFIGVADMQGNLKFHNRAALRMVGLPEGVNLSQLKISDMHPEWAGRKVIEEGIPAVMKSGVWQSNNALLHRDGHEIPVSQVLMVHRDEKGDPVFLSTIMRDISESLRIQQAMQEKSEELARSNAELEQFAYVASHDLQEPLRMVSSYTQLLAKRFPDKLDKDANEFIAYAVDGAARMQRLIQDLLLYSRVGRGAALAPCELQAAYDLALRNLRLALEESQAQVTHDPLPQVMGDTGQLAQLLQNLIGNALKFRGERAPTVHVSAERDGAMWRIGVRDNGIGIEPEYHQRIFVIFQRLHTRERYAGTGIGLAICKKIVERHAGRIWVESQPGQGTTFFFTLAAVSENGR